MVTAEEVDPRPAFDELHDPRLLGLGLKAQAVEQGGEPRRGGLRFVVGLALVHDLVLAPLVVLVGWGVVRLVPARARGAVQAALIASAVVALFAVPFVRGYGRVSTNPSILPRNYAHGTLVVVALVWLAAPVALVIRWRSDRRRYAPSGAR